MNKQPCSILNDVIGPIMTGPSSSHTAGPARIGKMGRMLLGEDVKSIEIIVDEHGSYPATFRGQCSDKGFVGGLLGFEPQNSNLKNSINIAKEKGIELKFRKADLVASHPNTAQVNLVGGNENSLSMITCSTGGGMFEIVQIEEFEIKIYGDFKEILVLFPNDEMLVMQIDHLLESLEENNYKIIKRNNKNRCLYEIKTKHDIPAKLMNQLEQIKEIIWIRTADIILPVASQFEYNLPFSTAKEALAYGKKENLMLWELATHYEMARSGMTEEEIFQKMEEIIEIMKASALDSIRGNTYKRGYLEPKAHEMYESLKNKKLANIGIMNKVMVWATAIMEYDNSMGVVVAAPTAGSCGVLPGAIIAVGEDMGLSMRDVVKGMLAAGIVGVFIANQATFAAEVCACQAENGSASAMAAAGVVQLLGGSIEEGFKAAGLALQNLLGLVCDPVAGLVDVPCINRNTVAAVNGITSANMVICGFDPFIPLDEVVKAMWEVGNMLPKELRCTGLGGLCATKTGMKIAKVMETKREAL